MADVLIKNIPIDLIELNEGQLYGLPSNPRWIRDARYEALKKSIEDEPEMLAYRELLVYPLSDLAGHEDHFIIIGGNMRFRACKELGYTELPCKVFPLETPVKKLRAYTIKDNLAFGQNDWDLLASEWETEELQSWGMELDYVAPGEGDQWDELPEVEGDPEPPSLSKPFVIQVQVDKSEKDNLDTITELIKQAVAEYQCEVK